MKRNTILSMDDLRSLSKGSVSTSTREKLKAWAKQELDRRERSGKLGGRPRGTKRRIVKPDYEPMDDIA